MCDYSLAFLDTRLAEVGERLTLFRHINGSAGFASPSQATAYNAWCSTEDKRRNGMLARLAGTALTGNNGPVVCAVCVAPGTRLALSGLSQVVAKVYQVESDEDVIFTQVSAEPNEHRDAVIFKNGKTVKLIELNPGMEAVIESDEGSGAREEILEFAEIR